MLTNIWYDICTIFFLDWLKRFVGPSFITLTHTQNQILSYQSDTSTQMEACVMIRYWDHYMDLENVSAPGGTWLMLRYLCSLLLFSLVSTSRRTSTLAKGMMRIHSQATAQGMVFSSYQRHGRPEGLIAGVSLPSRPYPFKCSITPRDRKVEELIMDLPQAA